MLFLKRLITSDEKLIKYENVKRKGSWSKRNEMTQTTVKPGLTANKVTLSVWWDWIYYEILEPGQMVDSVLYCQQLTRLHKAIQKKCPESVNRKGVVFHHDNAKPHTSLVTRPKLTELVWEVLIVPPYSPDLAPSDYHLFRSLQNFLDGKKLANKKAAENHVAKFFATNPQKVYPDGIMKLPEKWQKVRDNNGTYLFLKGVPRQMYTCEWALTLIYHQLQVHILTDYDSLVFYNSNHGVKHISRTFKYRKNSL